jgi:glyoxylase I family protein
MSVMSVMSVCIFLILPLSLSLSYNLKHKNIRSNTSLDCNAKTNELRYGGLNHCGILVKNTELSKSFFIEVFGFLDDSHLRPKTLPYPGAFLRFGRDQIHLMVLPNPDPIDNRPEHGGRDRHVALTVNNIDIIADRLKQRNVKYTLSMSGRRALFCRDIDGNAFEFMEDVNL